MDEATVRQIVRDEAREAMREVLGETLMRALGIMPAPEPDPLWSLSVPELVQRINVADADELAAIEAAERSHPDGPRQNVLMVCGMRRERLNMERAA